MKNALFWNLLAKHYSKQPVANQDAYQKKLDQTQKYLNSQSKVYEFGCGTGSTALYHAPKVHSVLATDISKKMISIAKDKAAEQKIENVKFECATLEDTIQDSSYDLVMAHSILHLIENRKESLEHLNKMLSQNGIFISSTICMQDAFPKMKFLTTIGHFFGFMPLIKYFSQTQLKDEIEAAGFEILDCWQPGPKEATFIVARKL